MNENLKISGIVMNQWSQVCKPLKNEEERRYKIQRAIFLGQVSHIYDKNSYIVRYFDLNFLISNEIVMVMWRDEKYPSVKVFNHLKKYYRKFFKPVTENLTKKGEM